MFMLRSLAVVVALLSLVNCGNRNSFNGVSDGQVFIIESFPGFTVTSNDTSTPIQISGAEQLSRSGISCYSQQPGTATCQRGFGGGGFNPNQYNPGGFNPNQYNPNQYNPNQYNPNQYNPNQYNPNQYNPNQYNPQFGGGTCSRNAPCTVTFSQGGDSIRVIFQSQF